MDVTIPCVCPGTPHDEDVVTLKDRLSFHEATAIRKGIRLATDDDDPMATEERLARAVEGYILQGIAAWTLVDERGKRLPVSRVAIAEHILAHDEAAFLVGEAADPLYAGAVVLPLLRRASSSSPSTPTASSTSPTNGGRPTPLPKRSSRSSTTSTPTGGTGTTRSPRGGDSNSSPKSVSAA